MNRGAFVIGLLSAIGAFPALAQVSTPQVPPPTPPYLTNPPERSSWKVVVTQSGAAPAAATPAPVPGASPTPAVKLLKEQDWTKTGSILRCINQWSDGSTTQDWIVGPIELSEDPGGLGIRVYLAKSNLLYHDFTKSDFDHLDWLTPDTFVQVVKHDGQTCYSFKSKPALSPVAVPGQSLTQMATPDEETTAYIDVQTHFPVEIDSASQQSVYQFGPPPSTDLVLPDRFLALWKDLKAHHQ